MGYKREQWHSGLTYEQICEECQAVVQYTDHALDFRPWYADGYVDCPRCKSHLRHNEKYALEGSDAQPQKIKRPVMVPAPTVKAAPVEEKPTEVAPVAETPAAAVVEEPVVEEPVVEAPVVEEPIVEEPVVEVAPAPVVEEEAEIFVDAKPIEPAARPMFCVRCGNKFNETDRFCAQCGSKRD